jgi:hypothetical protein
MKPPRVLQPHLDFYHGELNQAPRDLFETGKTCRAASRNAVFSVGWGYQSVLTVPFWISRSLLRSDRPPLARNGHYEPDAGIASGVSDTSEAHGSGDGPMFVRHS